MPLPSSSRFRGSANLVASRVCYAPAKGARRAYNIPPEYGKEIRESDIAFVRQAAELSLTSEGLTHPHPNHGAILVTEDGDVAGTAFQRAQGAPSAEQQLLRDAGPAARGATIYLNLETGDCHGDTKALELIVQSGVRRVVMGHRHPLSHMRGVAASILQASGIDVHLLEAHPEAFTAGSSAHQALYSCLHANEPLLHREVLGVPMSTLKYAMTLDGKIATHTGHSAWVSNAASRQRVFEQRAASDSVIVGGNTVRRDNPRLTTRRDRGHFPTRIIMTRCLDLPADANVFDVSVAPTIVMTQQGAQPATQAALRDRGVEVVEFDFLTPANVAAYCADRGFLRCFWECGGTLSAPALASGTIHKVMTFIAPKIIGGTNSYTPVGNLGFVQMTQAVPLLDPSYEVIENDILAQGSLPSSGGPLVLYTRLLERQESVGAATTMSPPLRRGDGAAATRGAGAVSGGAADEAARDAGAAHAQHWEVHDAMAAAAAAMRRERSGATGVVEFYKAWDEWGALSNFSPHPIDMPRGQADCPTVAAGGAAMQCRWASVEHFYQAQKFMHAEGAVDDALRARAEGVVDEIVAAPSPEEAARKGRFHERVSEELMRGDWAEAKIRVMEAAVMEKFRRHAGPRAMLLSTAAEGLRLVEASPNDFFWGCGRTGSGRNMLGVLLQRVREQLLHEEEEGGALESEELEHAV